MPSRLATLLVLASLSVAYADGTCRVELGRGWAAGNGRGQIVMKSSGGGCGAALLIAPEVGIPAEEVRVVTPPAHGVVTVTAPRFTYTPKAGFAGQDTFGLVATGRNREGGRAELRGEVTVEVSR